MIFVLNKSDLINPEDVIERRKYLKLDDSKKLINISSKTGKNISQLKDLISKMLELKKSSKEELDKIHGFWSIKNRSEVSKRW